jgi:hypothetical protein
MQSDWITAQERDFSNVEGQPDSMLEVMPGYVKPDTTVRFQATCFLQLGRSGLFMVKPHLSSKPRRGGIIAAMSLLRSFGVFLPASHECDRDHELTTRRCKCHQARQVVARHVRHHG